MSIHELLEDCPFFLSEAKDKYTAIREMIAAAKNSGIRADFGEIEKSVIDREKIVSTGIGLGIAAPHTRLHDLDRFIVAVVIFKKPIEWDAIDGKPVRAAFLIVGPASQQKKYLELLAKLVLLVKNPSRREQLYEVRTKEELLKLFERF